MATNNPRSPYPREAREGSAKQSGGQLAEVSSNVRQAAEGAATAVAEKAQQAWDATKDRAEHLPTDVSDAASNAWDDVAGLIRRYPVAAFGVGLAVGCLLACATSRGDAMTRRMSQYSA